MVSAENHADLQSQYDAGDLVISGALAGDNALPTQDDALALEQVFLDAEPDLVALIRGNRMRHDRRAIALKPANLSWQVDGNNVILTFSLDAGSFATSIIRELVQEIAFEREF